MDDDDEHLIAHAASSWVDKFTAAVAKDPVAFGLMLFTFFAFWSVFGLSAYHSILIAIGETTNEHIRLVYKGEDGEEKKKEWDRGVLGNCCVHWCRSRGHKRLGEMSEIMLGPSEKKESEEFSNSV